MTNPWRYQIRVQGRLSSRWAHWFEDLDVSVQCEAGSETTTLTGAMIDQAALLGVLQRLYTLGLPLLLVRCQEGSDVVDRPGE
jgi:hypothetical protein